MEKSPAQHRRVDAFGEAADAVVASGGETCDNQPTPTSVTAPATQPMRISDTLIAHVPPPAADVPPSSPRLIARARFRRSGSAEGYGRDRRERQVPRRKRVLL